MQLFFVYFRMIFQAPFPTSTYITVSKFYMFFNQNWNFIELMD